MLGLDGPLRWVNAGMDNNNDDDDDDFINPYNNDQRNNYHLHSTGPGRSSDYRNNCNNDLIRNSLTSSLVIPPPPPLSSKMSSPGLMSQFGVMSQFASFRPLHLNAAPLEPVVYHNTDNKPTRLTSQQRNLHSSSSTSSSFSSVMQESSALPTDHYPTNFDHVRDPKPS